MMPAATTTVARPVSASAYDRMFFSGIAAVMAIVVFAGFAPTFYLRSYFGAPTTVTGAVTLTPLAQLHGFVFSAWVILFVIQTSLIASRRVAVHRRLGLAGVGLAAVMTVVGLMTAFAAAKRGSAPPEMSAREFLVVPVFDIVLFVGFVTAAVLRRREKDAHKRLMLLAYAAILPAAVGRLPGIIALGPAALFVLAFMPAVAGAIYDRWSRGKVSSIYWWGIAALYLSIPVRIALSTTAPWLAFADFVIGK